MRSISENLSRILDCKKNIKKSIENKLKVNNISNKLSEWPSLIYSIDINQSDDSDEQEELIQDEYTHIWFLPTNNTGVQSFQINITGETTIDWGDGTEPDVLTTPGLQFATHIYSTIPTSNSTNKGVGCINYTIVEIKVYSEFDYCFEGQGATPDSTMTKSNIPAFNTIANTMTKFVASENCEVRNWGFAACPSLKNFVLSHRQTILYSQMFAYFRGTMTIKFPEHITEIQTNCFNQSTSINKIILNESITTLGTNAFYGLSIKEIEIPTSITYMGTGIFGTCKQLKKVIWKSPYKYIPSSMFSGCYALEVLDLSYATEQMYFGTNINTIGNSSSIALIPGQTKIIVSKSLYNDWKSNSRWIYFQNYLYWKDENGELHNTMVE